MDSQQNAKFSTSEQLDLILNKTALDIFVYSAIGYTAGLCVRMFFKRSKASIGAGLGCGYAFNLNKRHFNNWSKYNLNQQ